MWDNYVTSICVLICVITASLILSVRSTPGWSGFKGKEDYESSKAKYEEWRAKQREKSDFPKKPDHDPKSIFPSEKRLSTEFNGISYKVLSWTNEEGGREFKGLEHADAVAACRDFKNNGSLLTIKSQIENDFLVTWLADQLGVQNPIWLSLERIKGTNDFIWPEGQRMSSGGFTNWHKCEPNDITTNVWGVANWAENCVEMYTHIYPYPAICDVNAKAGQWNDIPCTNTERVVVCQSVN